MLLAEFVGGFGDTLELGLALEVEEDGCLLHKAAFEDALDDFVAVEGLFGLAEDFRDDVGNSALFVTPLF